MTEQERAAALADKAEQCLDAYRTRYTRPSTGGIRNSAPMRVEFGELSLALNDYRALAARPAVPAEGSEWTVEYDNVGDADGCGFEEWWTALFKGDAMARFYVEADANEYVAMMNARSNAPVLPADLREVVAKETVNGWPSDGSCFRCGCVPRNKTGLCPTCVDEDLDLQKNTPVSLVKTMQRAIENSVSVTIALGDDEYNINSRDVVLSILSAIASHGYEVVPVGESAAPKTPTGGADV